MIITRSAALLLFLATPLVAQVRETVNVNVVEVPVTVVDRDGNPVRGLTAANFELTDDGKKQTVTSFESIDFASKESVSAISPLNANARRSFMLLFDLGYSAPNSLTRAREAARAFVQKNMKPRDLVAVGTFDRDRGFRLVTSFTTDRQLIDQAIEKPATFKGSDPLSIANVVLQANKSDFAAPDLPGDQNKTSDGMGNSKSGASQMDFKEEARAINQSIAKQSEEYMRGKVEKQIQSLGSLASMLNAVPGRKHVVLLSEGFDAKFVTGRDVHEDTSKENEDSLHGRVWQVDTDARYGTSGSTKILDDMAKIFRGSDVVLDAIDIAGLRMKNDLQTGVGSSDVPSAMRSTGSNDGLAALARPTGGNVFRNANDLTSNFDRMMRAQEVVYVLAFQTATAKPGKFHNLNVKLVNAPSGVRPSFRSGYYETGSETREQRSLSNAEIIVNDIPQNGVRTHAMAGAFPAEGENAQVPVIVELNGADLLQGVTGNPGLEFYIYAFDADGVVRDRIYQTISLDLTKAGEKLKNTGLKYWGTLSLPPGTYAIKTLVKVASLERRGFARTDVVVPKSGEPAVVPFFIDEKPSEWVLAKGISHQQNAAYPFLIDGRNVIPSTGGRDREGQNRKLAVVVRNVAPDQVTIETTPKATMLGKAAAGEATAFMMQVDGAPADPTLQVSVKRNGTAIAAPTTVTIQ